LWQSLCYWLIKDEITITECQCSRPMPIEESFSLIDPSEQWDPEVDEIEWDYDYYKDRDQYGLDDNE